MSTAHLERVVLLVHLAHPDSVEQGLAGCLRDKHLVVRLHRNQHARRVTPVCQLPHQQVLGLVLVCRVALTQHSDGKVRPLTKIEKFNCLLNYIHSESQKHSLSMPMARFDHSLE